MIIVQLHEHAVSFFQYLCRHMRSEFAELHVGPAAVLHDPTPPSSSGELVRIRSSNSSKKRKHVSSGSSLSDFVTSPESAGMQPPTSTTFFSGTESTWRSSVPAADSQDSSPSLSSSSGCSSTGTGVAVPSDPPVLSLPPPHPPVPADNANDWNHQELWPPNVTLPPAPGRPITRVSSIGSGRGGSLDESTTITSPPTASVLIVSHGGLLCELVQHFADELQCRLPGGPASASQITPNAGLSRFCVTLLPPVDEDEASDPTAWIGAKIECLTLHDKGHLANDIDAIPLVMHEAF